MSAPGTPKASQAAITAVQEAPTICACGHTKKSHVAGYCIGCTGPDCLSGYEAAVRRHFDEPFAADLIAKTRALLEDAQNQMLDDLGEEDHHGILAAQGSNPPDPACHPKCVLGPGQDHPGYLEYRCIDENVNALPFPGEMDCTCTCTGVGLRIKLAALTGEVRHADGCPCADRIEAGR